MVRSFEILSTRTMNPNESLPPRVEKPPRLLDPVRWSMYGVLAGLGAPAGLWALLNLLEPGSEEDIIRAVYIYTAVSSSVVFAIFGVLAGRMMSKLRSASTHDQLTGLCNRRFLLGQMPGLLANRDRRAEPLCVLMLDLDHFKRVNDQHGHAVGDQTLIAVARSLEREIRRGDLLARYGGEEFVVVCPNADEQSGTQVAERIREAISSLGPEQLGFHGVQTASCGLVVTRDKLDDATTLLMRADEALYEAKQTGRNKVCVFGPQ